MSFVIDARGSCVIAQTKGKTCVGKLWQCVENIVIAIMDGQQSRSLLSLAVGALWLMVTKT